MNCIYCGNKYLYTLKENNLKCAKCKRKFSPSKVEREYRLIEAFCADTTALMASKSLAISYVSLKKRFDFYRVEIAYYLENLYQQNTNTTQAYGEYIYLEKSKKRDKKSILEAYNFITFDKGEIYNLLLDSLNTFHYSFRYSEDESNYKEFNSFLLQSKISHLTKTKNNIEEFWRFFERFITKYKGIKPKNFYYYLKLSEFYFNFSYEERVEILKKIIYK